MQFVDVILPLSIPGLFTYRIPSVWENKIQVGVRVLVDFGKGEKKYAALTAKIHTQAPSYTCKDILDILDEEPMVTPYQLDFWQWMARYYMAHLGEVMNAALPAGYKIEESLQIYWKDTAVNDNTFTGDERMAYEFLQAVPVADFDAFSRLPFRVRPQTLLNRLLKKGWIGIEEKIQKKYRPKEETYLQLASSARNEAFLHTLLDQYAKKAYKQMEALQVMIMLSGEDFSKPVRKKILTGKYKISEQALRELVKKNILEICSLPVERLFSEDSSSLLPLNVLNPYQEMALQEIKEGFRQQRPVLLKGVTGSGKTEIYIHLIREYLQQGKQVLYLLPEIALTYQIIQRLKSFFGKAVGVYHSRFSFHERFEIWNELLQFRQGRDNAFQVIVGARSAIFLPFKNLGLIIVDEEHDASYKQEDPSPRYNARDAAIVMARQLQIPLLLGSATPSIEMYQRAMQGEILLTELRYRHDNAVLPEVTIIDRKPEIRKNKKLPLLSPELKNAIDEVLKQQRQVILFHNRRGYAPVCLCLDCEYIHMCDHCEVPLTYHKQYHKYSCHLCGRPKEVFRQCQRCGSPNILTKGMGTERIEEEIKLLFPDAVVARLDYDSTRSKNSYHRILTDFSEGEIDILIGTQMVTKGLDFDRVLLVGVLNADGLLAFPDFRCHERAYQILTQVAGRSGRKEKGRVLIQTFQPKHSILSMVATHDYEAMAAAEISFRKEFYYPPFVHLITIRVLHREEEIARHQARHLAEQLRSTLGYRVLGPEFDRIVKAKQWFRMNVWVKIFKKDNHMAVKQCIRENISLILQQNSTLKIQVDVDPY